MGARRAQSGGFNASRDKGLSVARLAGASAERAGRMDMACQRRCYSDLCQSERISHERNASRVGRG